MSKQLTEACWFALLSALFYRPSCRQTRGCLLIEVIWPERISYISKLFQYNKWCLLVQNSLQWIKSVAKWLLMCSKCFLTCFSYVICHFKCSSHFKVKYSWSQKFKYTLQNLQNVHYFTKIRRIIQNICNILMNTVLKKTFCIRDVYINLIEIKETSAIEYIP